MPEVVGLKLQLALDRFPYPWLRVHEPVLLGKQQEKAYTDMHGLKRPQHTCTVGVYGTAGGGAEMLYRLRSLMGAGLD